jgi:hypothetical protein
VDDAMKKIFVSQWCDMPGCAEAALAAGTHVTKGQSVKPLQSWFYQPDTRGRRARVMSNLLCEDHMAVVLKMRDELKVHGEPYGETSPTAAMLSGDE